MAITADDVLADVLRLIESTLKVPSDEVDIDASLESFGINSLIVMELMENIEKEFDLTLTPAQFSNIDTVRGMVGLIEGLLEKGNSGSTASPPVTAHAPGPAAATGSASPTATATSPALLDFVKLKYSVDLSARAYSSLEDLADSLIATHASDLLSYYGIGAAGASLATPGQRSTDSGLVAIVGLSCRLPGAPDPHAYWKLLSAGSSAIAEIPTSRWDWRAHHAETPTPGKTVSRWGALIDDVDCFDAEFFGISAEEARSIDPQLRLLMQESYRAVEDAGINMQVLAGSKTGVFIGYEYAEYELQLRRLNNTDASKGPLFSSSSPSYYLSNRISHCFDLYGPSEAFNLNCASSAVAVNRACQSLRERESDVALVAAASLNLFADDYVAASQYGVLSPTGTCAVFDDHANGFTRGEGVAAVVLKRLEDAERDGDRIYALVRCSQQNYRGIARNISEVKHEAITRTLQDCYDKAGVPAQSIRYIEVDGYANKWADSFEYEGIKGAFEASGAGAKHVALGSAKANIGNVESVSGLASLIKLALAFEHKRFPATIAVDKVNSYLDVDSPNHPLYLATRELPFDELRNEAGEPVRAGINSFADSGVYVHLVLEEYQGLANRTSEVAAQPGLFLLSARSPERLSEQLGQFLRFLESDAAADLAFNDLIHTSQVGRASMDVRLAAVAKDASDLVSKLRLVQKQGLRDKLGMEGRGVFYQRLDTTDRNPLAAVISAEMVDAQLQQSRSSGDWRAIAQFWASGVQVRFASIWPRGGARRIALPTYPFARERHWIELPAESANDNGPAQAPPAVSNVSAGSDRADEPTADSVAPQWHFYLPMDPDAADGAQPLPAAEKIELFLRQEIGRHTGRKTDLVPADKDFIELGMNSIGVAELIMKLDQLLGINLSPSVLFKHPEPGSLARHLAEAHAPAIDALAVSDSAPDPHSVRTPFVELDGIGTVKVPALPSDLIVPLTTKASARLMALPGAGGSALSLQLLARQLEPEWSMVCIEPAGLDPRCLASDSVEQAAALSLQALREVQPDGPYALLGYSNGGILAYEIARQLLADGEQVEHLYLLDTVSPAQLRTQPIEPMLIKVFLHFAQSLGVDLDIDGGVLHALSDTDRAEYLYQRLRQSGAELPRQQFMATFATAIASEHACRAYQPEPLAQTACLIRAANAFPELPRDYGWALMLGDQLRIIDVDADHFSLLEAPAMAPLTAALTPPKPTDNPIAKPISARRRRGGR